MKQPHFCLAISLLTCAYYSSEINCAQAKEIADCDFLDTVDLTKSQKFSNGSYLYENVLIPSNLTGIYNYDLVYGMERINVSDHVRGCVCKLKSCVKFCCHPTEKLLNYTMECGKEMNEELDYSPYINVTLNNGSRQLMHVLDEYVVQQGIPCDNGYPLSPQEYEEDNWELFENGTLWRMYDNAFMNKSEYCLSPNNINGTYILNPTNCPIYIEMNSREKINGITLLISIPFLIATIIVYLAIPKLRNLHGKCLVCYLIALAMGSITLTILFFENTESDANYWPILCCSLGYLAYYCFLSAFFWLSVISFDLWHHFQMAIVDNNRLMLRKRFLLYSAYAWSLPLVMTGLTFYAQNSDLDEKLKPGIGIRYCWLDVELWSPMIYFYGPILILITFNIITFILIAIKIYKVKKEMKRIAASKESTVRLSTQKDNFGLFLRLFIVMGVTWFLEVFSFIAGKDSFWAKLFYLPDICNAAQGVIIFILFVLRRSVRILIMKRLSGESSDIYSTARSTSSGVNVPLHRNAKERESTKF